MNTLNAVYYARVSTDEERQLNALEKQCADLVDCINANHWNLVDSYVDEGKSGTSINKRDEYTRLFNDLDTNKFDVIVIKSQDRLMRNVKDWYIFVDKLVTNNKKLFIYMENDFYKTDDSLITGIKAILAAEYSRDLSKKLNNAHKRREKLGSSVMTNGTMIGYDQVNGELVINEKEAIIVRRVFNMYLNGMGVLKISKALADDGILNNNGNPYGVSTLMRMLKNEKYMGTMICNKYHKDFDTKRIIRNDESEWIIHENRIPPIISKEVFNKAKEIRLSRLSDDDGRKRGKKSKQHILSEKIICGECGSNMSVFNIKRKNGNINHRIFCLNFSKNGRLGVGLFPDLGCNMPNASPDKLNTIINKIIESIEIDDNYLHNSLEKMKGTDELKEIKSDLCKVKKQIETIKQKREILLDKYLDGIVDDDIYSIKNQKMLDEQESLIKLRDELEVKESSYNNNEQRINSIIERIKNEKLKYETFVDMVEKIVVYRDCVYFYIIGIETPFVVNESINYKRA